MSESHPVRRQLVLAICCLSACLSGIDLTIVNVALPSIRGALHASVSGLQWTTDAYTLVIACFLMLAGSLADRFGRKRVFQTGLSVFTLGSLLCSVAPSVGWLVAFRGLQAVGGSMLNPVAISIIVTVFPDRNERARAVGVWGSAAGAGQALGPVLGGILVSGVGWRSVFWVNIVIALAAIALTQRFVPESKATRARSLDPIGQVLIIILFASITAGTIEGPQHGWSSAFIRGLFALAAVAFVALLIVELRRREPLINPRFFRSAPFSGATLIALAASAALGGFLFLNTLYLQEVRGYSPLRAGIMTVPLAVMFGVFANISGRLVAARGPRLSLVLAGGFLMFGPLMLVGLGAHTSTIYLLVAYAVFGIGSGLVAPPITNTAVSGMPADQAGVAGAVAASSRQFGSAMGVAITGTLVTTAGAGLTIVSHAAWAVLVGCGVLVLLLGVVSTGRWAQQTAARNGERLAEEEKDRSRRQDQL
jgi:EmrB/QacA subfamily drug resistance transporter